MVRTDVGWEIVSFVIDCCGTWVVTFYFYVTKFLTELRL